MKTSARLLKRMHVLNNIDITACFSDNLFAGNSLVTMIAKGDNGTVYRACTPITRDNEKVSCSNNNTLFAVKLVKRLSSHEHTTLEICLKLVSENICPNFTILYGIIKCRQCPLLSSTCSVFVTEYAHDGDMARWIRSVTNTKHIDNVMFQVCCAVYTLFKHGRRAHNDLHLGNILVHSVSPGGSWTYVIDGKQYHCPNVGVLVTLTDFDKCRPTTETLDHARVAKLIRLTCHKIPDTTKTLLRSIEAAPIPQVFDLFGYTRRILPVIEQYTI